MPARGALWNPQTLLELQALTAVIAGISPRKHRKVERPELPAKRPGWSQKLVLAVLGATSEPLTVMEIVRAVEAQTGEIVGKETVRSIVRTSAVARSGQIVHVPGGGQYGRYQLNPEWEPPGELDLRCS